MSNKLKWRVGEKPTGRYRSFQKRSWPAADLPGTETSAFMITCEDEYSPEAVKQLTHKPLRLSYAHHSDLEVGFTWRRFVKPFDTLKEAKDFAQKFFENKPHVFVNKPPKPVEEDEPSW